MNEERLVLLNRNCCKNELFNNAFKGKDFNLRYKVAQNVMFRKFQSGLLSYLPIHTKGKLATAFFINEDFQKNTQGKVLNGNIKELATRDIFITEDQFNFISPLLHKPTLENAGYVISVKKMICPVGWYKLISLIRPFDMEEFEELKSLKKFLSASQKNKVS